MIFHFGTGGDTNAAKKELYKAMQYSGLVTEDMTFEEMCEVLAAEYPDILKLYMTSANEGGFLTYRGKPNEAAWTGDLESLSVTFGGNISVNHYCSSGQRGGSIVSEAVDLTKYDVLSFDYTLESGSLYVFITSSLNTTMASVAFSALSGNGTKNIDISKLSGEYHICFFMNHYYPYSIKVTLGNIYLQ